MHLSDKPLHEHQDIIRQYRLLRDDIDCHVRQLLKLHSEAIQCRPKCVDCCINLTVWPVEFYAILDELKAANVKPIFDPLAPCGFLKDSLCQIYPFRPIICRTHGLPLVYLDDEQDEPTYGVTFCEKNFQDTDELAFGPDNTLDMDAVNGTLARLHTAFLEAGKQEGPDVHGRIALARLTEYL